MSKPITITVGPAQQLPSGFHRSIELLLTLGIEEARADSCCLYIYDSESRTLSLRVRKGGNAGQIGFARIQLSNPATEWLEALDGPAIVRHSAHVDVRTESFPEVFEGEMTTLMVVPARLREEASCLLTFGYREHGLPPDGAVAAMTLLARRIAALLTGESGMRDLVELATRAAALETQLADMKIAQRTSGVIEAQTRGAEVIAALATHIDGVLAGGRVREDLGRLVDGLEEKVRGRRLIDYAKARLQQAAKLSEDQAYLHMRNTSRKTRRPLVVVAQEVIARTA